MQLTSPPFWLLPFNKRKIGIALHSIRDLVVFDLAGQKNLPEDKIRLYVANENKLYLLFAKHTDSHLTLPKSEKQAWLGLKAYSAFLNPHIPRPVQFDEKINPENDYLSSSYYFYNSGYTFCDSCNGSGEELSVHGVGTGLPCSYCGGSGTRK